MKKLQLLPLEKEIARCNNIQMAKKISLNSAYGAIGNQYFRYYKLANAEAITLSGQVSIRWIENKMNDYLNKILKTEEVDYVIASVILIVHLPQSWPSGGGHIQRSERRMVLKASFRSLIRCVKWNSKNILRILMRRWPSM